MEKIIKSILLFILLVIPFLNTNLTYAQEETVSENKYAIYFGGIGCPHCAKVSPVLLKKVSEGGFVFVEYEIYKNLANSQALSSYADEYDLSLGIPQIMFDRESKESGDTPILGKLDEMISNAKPNTLFLSDGTEVSFEDLDLNDLERYPTFYAKDRVAIKKSLRTLTDEQNTQIKEFISSKEISEAIKDLDGKSVKTSKLEYSGGSLTFDNALEVNGWLLQWNGEDTQNNSGIVNDGDTQSGDEAGGVSVWKTIMLGLADSVNPCAISVLALMLIAIVTYNPGDRKQILFAGLSFVLAVIIMYLLYGYLIITAFQFVQSIASIKLYIYKALGVGAILLGILELKDYFKYKPGSIGTEMPLFLRPKVNEIISKVTSPAGAFGMGLFVTLFLLPCTIGPYIILGGMLADGGFVASIPMLLLYNLVFVSPMIIVTILVYIGSKKAEDVKDWKERNVRKMHLVAGALMLLIGTLMVLGVI